MTKESLKKANDLHQIYLQADSAFDKIQEFKNEHEQSEKDLNLSNVGSGWVSIPAHRKIEVLNLVWDIAKQEYDKARKFFEEFNP